MINEGFNIKNGELLKYTGKDEDVIIPDGVKQIKEEAFSGNINLRSVTIPHGTVCIGAWAFEGCSNLKKITIPNSIKEIGSFVFLNCVNLSGNLYDNAYYIGNNENPYYILIYAKDRDIASCKIHKNTKHIMEFAFFQCEYLTELTMPEGLISIRSYAFKFCKQLKQIVLPKSIQHITGLVIYRCGIEKIFYTGTITDRSDKQLSVLRFCPQDKTYYYSKNNPTTEGKFWHYDKEMKNIIEW